MTNPQTITLCGSITRDIHDLTRIHRALALAGHLAYSPVPPLPGEPDLTAEQLANLTAGHYAAIDASDLVIGVAADGRIGTSTSGELRYARTRGIPVRVADSPDQITELLDDITAGRPLTPDHEARG